MMLSLKTTIIFLFPLLCFVNPQKQDGQELPPVPSFVILTPQTVRPDEILKTSVTVLKLLYTQLTIRLMIKHEYAPGKDKEYANTFEIFKTTGTRIVSLRIPKTLVPGNYFIHVEGSVEPNSALIFTNRTKINFNPKQVSMFIQTCKPIYHQGQTVRIRVVPVKPNLMPVYGTLMKLEVLDATGYIIRRWMTPMTNVGGVVEKEFTLSDQIAEGEWQVLATHESYTETKTFFVTEYWQPRFDVNVTLPLRLSSDGFGVYGILGANHTSSMPVKGNATIFLQIKQQNKVLAEITRYIPFFEGKADFLFSMSELSQRINGGELKNMEVYVRATVLDWFLVMTSTGFGRTFIYAKEPELKFFGGLVRPFKPNMYFTIFMVAYQPDGTRIFVTENRSVRITISCNERQSDREVFPGLPIPDDGVVSVTFVPKDNCITYMVQGNLLDAVGQSLKESQQFLTRYHSESGTYMQISTSTYRPRVNEYAVFNVKTNYPTDTLYYQIAAFGNIIYADTLKMATPVMSRTFSVAISRDMAPIARIVCFFVKQNGEIVSDALTFFANITLLNNVEVVVNRGKDLNVDTLEVIGAGTPGSWISMSVVHYDLYVHGAASILQDYNLIDEMRTFERHSQQPFEHTWYQDMDFPEKIYYPSPSFGADTNTTFNTSGLILFTDANFTKVNFYHDCNETEDLARAYPCYTYSGKACYSRKERCDGTPQCITYIDEMNCEEKENDVGIKRSLYDFNLQYRHFVDAGWMWKGFFIKPDGKIQFRVDLPKVDTSWVVGAFAVDNYKGFSIQRMPSRFSGVRRFFITVECPEEVYGGEQIGVRVGVFNYWNYWAEALVEIQRSPDVRIVRVGFDRGWQGKINAYEPLIVVNKVVQTLVYLDAGEGKYIHMPVLPKYEAGNTTFTICAYTFIGSNCETRTVLVKMTGVAKYYHTGVYQDMTSYSSLYTKSLFIVVPQMFNTPEERQLRYVPGSQLAKVVIVGDVIGPSLGDTLSFADTESTLRMPHGAAENVIFELGYNLELLHYQWKAGYLPFDAMKRGLNYCNMMIQQSLSYYDNKTGGLSNFRESLDRPSVFPTAMAVWMYVLTGVSEWDKYIFIPKDLYKNLLIFIRSKQEVSGYLEGSFPLEEVLDLKFMPIIDDPNLSADKKEALRRIPLTALVCLSVSEVELKLPGGDPREQGDIIKAAASNFIRTHLPDVTDVFSRAIGTLALIRSSNTLSADIISKSLDYLQSKNMGESNFYLANFKVPAPVVRSTERGQENILPRKEWPNDGYAVAATSLYFTMMMERNVWKSGTDAANTMVSWLATMRNHASGFASTFDSLLALKALKRYALLDNNRQLYKMQVVSRATSTRSWTEVINIHRHNYTTASYRDLRAENVWGEIETTTEGTGKLLIQLSVSVNVQYENKLKFPTNPKTPDDEIMYPSFEIVCTPQFSGRNNSVMVMKACGRWVGTEPPLGLPHSGMAVYEIDVPTGYVSLNNDLRDYVNSKKVPNLRYARYRPGKVHFYFDKITPEPTCIEFRSDRFYPVANMTIELLCSAYDYYEPGRYNLSLYRTRSLNTMNICLVCGSYQCPYCPYYNAAVRVAQVSLPLLIACICFVLIRYGRLPFLPSLMLSGAG